MTEINNISYNKKRSITQSVIIAMSLGLLLPLFAWAVDMVLNKYQISFSSLWEIHRVNPLHFLIDIFPFVAGIATFQYNRYSEKKNVYYIEQIKQRDNRIDQNARFAKQIGEGDFESAIEIDTKDDILAQSLLLMRDNLLLNSKKEKEQSWIAEGKDIISNILRMHNKIEDLSYDVLSNLIKYINSIQGALYIYDDDNDKLVNFATYAYNRKKFINQEFKIGQGLIGQCAYEKDIIYRTEIPEDYISITSGILGDTKPKSLLIVPLITDEKLMGVIEFASLEDSIPELTIKYLIELGEIIARTIFNLSVNEKTERLCQCRLSNR